ncbi:MAG: DinB superfamily protein [Nocardioides sp.]|nr:DinB superfamily protein [Nocardioides sp.]
MSAYGAILAQVTDIPSLRGAHLVDRYLDDVRIDRSVVDGMVMRGVAFEHLDIDAPFLHEGGVLLVNGVDVAPFVDAELERRFPGREQRFAPDPAGLRAAHAALVAAWDDLVARAEELPDDAVHAQVDDEWSLAQTIRHGVFAIDVWLGVCTGTDDVHPLGQPHAEAEESGFDLSRLDLDEAPWADVLAARADRDARVVAYLADVTDADLVREVPNPWWPDGTLTVRDALHTILGEGWEHLRFATRDLATVAEEI